MDIFISDMVVILIVFMWYMCLFVYCFLFPFDPTICHLFGGWRYFWMDGSNRLCILFYNSVSLLGIDG